MVGLANSNCSWCLNFMAARLAARPLVRSVHLDASNGCVVVEHDHDPAALVGEIHDDLRGWVAADTGEVVMVARRACGVGVPMSTDRTATPGWQRDRARQGRS